MASTYWNFPPRASRTEARAPEDGPPKGFFIVVQPDCHMHFVLATSPGGAARYLGRRALSSAVLTGRLTVVELGAGFVRQGAVPWAARAYRALTDRVFPPPAAPGQPTSAAPPLTVQTPDELIRLLASLPEGCLVVDACLPPHRLNQSSLGERGQARFVLDGRALADPLAGLEAHLAGRPGQQLCLVGADGRVWASSRLPVDPIAAGRSLGNALDKMPDLLAWTLAGRSDPHAESDLASPDVPGLSLGGALGAVAVAAGACSAFRTWVRRKRRTRGEVDRWRLLVGPAGEGANPDPARLHAIPQPEDRFWADPFLFRREGRTWLFFEDYPFRTRKGVIAALELDEAGRPTSDARTVLEAAHHLSYPFLFEWEGEVYMTPEAAESGRVVAYRATRFPDRWDEAATLLDGPFTDPTLFFYGGKWRLFVGASSRSNRPMFEDLHLYSASHPLGPYTPHPKNPIVSDAGCARPAGAVFRTTDGHLVRPGQDCLADYGAAVALREITHLNEESYAERFFARLAAPSPYTRMHTLNLAADLATVDVDDEPQPAAPATTTKKRGRG